VVAFGFWLSNRKVSIFVKRTPGSPLTGAAVRNETQGSTENDRVAASRTNAAILPESSSRASTL
jgi:hypothetical protein